MRISNRFRSVAWGLAVACSSAVAQTNLQTANLANPTPPAALAKTVRPALVPYSGIVLGSDGKPPAAGTEGGNVSITFLIFKEEQGGDPLWAETQTVSVDSDGHYKVQLGAASPSGLPLEVFASGEAR